MIVSGEKVTVGKVSFIEGGGGELQNKNLKDSIDHIAEEISKAVLENKYYK